MSEIAKVQLQAAYAVFTHALTNRWTFLMRTVPGTDRLLQPLEEAIRHQFLPAVKGRQGITELERDLLAIPARHSGLGITIPTINANNQFKACTEVTAPLVELIRQRSPKYPELSQLEQRQRKFEFRTRNRRETTKAADLLKPKLSVAGQRAMEQASEKGASAWLTSIPMSKHGFNLHKQAFRDALCLRFGWTPTRLATYCPCDQPFSVNHAFSCPKGAMPSEVCPNVCVEPTLQSLTGESFPLRSANTEDRARLWRQGPKFLGQKQTINLLWRQNFQLPRTIELYNFHRRLLQKTWTWEEENIQTVYPRGGAWYLYPPGSVHKWRLGSVCHGCLQETCRSHLWETRSTIQQHPQFYQM